MKKQMKFKSVIGHVMTENGYQELGSEGVVNGDNIYKGENYYPQTSEGRAFLEWCDENLNIEDIDHSNKTEPTVPQGGWLMQGR